MKDLTKEQKMLRYAISCDVDAMVEIGYTEEQIADWFKGVELDDVCSLDECYECEQHGIDPETGEDIFEVFNNEIRPVVFGQK